MWQSRGREEEMSDVVQMRLVLAGFREMAGLGFGLCSSPHSQSLGLYRNAVFSLHRISDWLERRDVCTQRVFVPDSLWGLKLLDVLPNAQNGTIYRIQFRPNEKDKSFHVLDRGAIAWETF